MIIILNLARLFLSVVLRRRAANNVGDEVSH